MLDDQPIPIFDEPPERSGADYSLPADEWNRMADLALDLAKRDNELLVECRLARWLAASPNP